MKLRQLQTYTKYKTIHQNMRWLWLKAPVNNSSPLQYLRFDPHSVYDVLRHAEHGTDRLDAALLLALVPVVEHGETGETEQGVEGVWEVAWSIGDAAWNREK